MNASVFLFLFIPLWLWLSSDVRSSVSTRASRSALCSSAIRHPTTDSPPPHEPSCSGSSTPPPASGGNRQARPALLDEEPGIHQRPGHFVDRTASNIHPGTRSVPMRRSVVCKHGRLVLPVCERV
ncbi:hypothetical protein JB92DRAFT_2924116 [Gautieria morchelliformis]|nr:hypothetical protein JB92DRAFT_2924116 [Gautieria morchelliformis]